jgi:hypothetical protein
LINEIGELIEEYILGSAEEWGRLNGGNCQNMPIFINYNNDDVLPEFKYHFSTIDIDRVVDATFEALNVNSERTGKPIRVNTRRFRYTRGTRAAREGASEFVIADLLDHSDTNNVGIYIEAVPEIIDRIDRALAIYLAPMARAFAGKLIDGEWQATRGSDPASRIISPENLTSPLGSCGHFGICGGMAPIACYTCGKFQPWLSKRHEEILNFHIEQRDRVRELTGDDTIASINDRTILACAEVVRQCESRMGGRE